MHRQIISLKMIIFDIISEKIDVLIKKIDAGAWVHFFSVPDG